MVVEDDEELVVLDRSAVVVGDDIVVDEPPPEIAVVVVVVEDALARVVDVVLRGALVVVDAGGGTTGTYTGLGVGAGRTVNHRAKTPTNATVSTTVDRRTRSFGMSGPRRRGHGGRRRDAGALQRQGNP